MRCRSYRHYWDVLSRELPALAFGDNAAPDTPGVSDAVLQALARPRMHDLTHLTDYKCLLTEGIELRLLTDPEARTLLQCSFSESQDTDHARLDDQLELDKAQLGMGYAILDARLKLAGIVTTPYLRLFVSSLCSSPGEAVMWAYTIALLSEEESPVTLMALLNKFPAGLPTDDAMSKVWDAQKRERPTQHASDNWLDVAAQWPSIRRTLVVDNERLAEKPS